MKPPYWDPFSVSSHFENGHPWPAWFEVTADSFRELVPWSCGSRLEHPIGAPHPSHFSACFTIIEPDRRCWVACLACRKHEAYPQLFFVESYGIWNHRFFSSFPCIPCYEESSDQWGKVDIPTTRWWIVKLIRCQVLDSQKHVLLVASASWCLDDKWGWNRWWGAVQTWGKTMEKLIVMDIFIGKGYEKPLNLAVSHVQTNSTHDGFMLVHVWQKQGNIYIYTVYICMNILWARVKICWSL